MPAGGACCYLSSRINGDFHVVDPEKLRQLVEMMSEHELSEISLRSGEEEIRLIRAMPRVQPDSLGGAGHAALGPPQVVANSPPQQLQASEVRDSSGATMASSARDAEEEDGLTAIESPMVGTFYASPDPKAPAFVTEGARVSESSVVCIIEAMKVFNEIKAGVAGTLVRVLVHNEEPVEYGQPLFLVRPA